MELNHNDDDGAATAEEEEAAASLPAATVFCIGQYNHNVEEEEEEVDELPMQRLSQLVVSRNKFLPCSHEFIHLG